VVIARVGPGQRPKARILLRRRRRGLHRHHEKALRRAKIRTI